MKRKSGIQTITILIIILFFGLTIPALRNNEPWTVGDSYEYVLQTVAFQNHLTFGISDADVAMAVEQFPDAEPYFEILFSPDYEGITLADNGYYYSNHFGIYSALVTPIKLLLLRIGINPIYAFRLTNLLLWIASVLVVFFCLKTDDKRKLGLILLLLFNPVFFYLTWAHTEIYLFSAAVIGLTFYYNRQYAPAILAVSLGAMQNPGLLPLGMMIGLAYIGTEIKDYTGRNKKGSLSVFLKEKGLRIISYGIFYIPALIPMITCYVHFGVINRVASVAMENKYILSKAKDYLFDLNLGMLPYEPVILFAFFILAVIGLVRQEPSAYMSLPAVCGMLYIICLEKQINCGMEAIMRYNVWILPCMIFYVVMNMELKGTYWIIICTEAAFTAFMVILSLWGTPEYNSYLEFAPWTKQVLDRCPQIYNPSHGVFYSRTLHNETYVCDVPVIYRNRNGCVRKILLSHKAKDAFYSEDYLLFRDDGTRSDKSLLQEKKADEGDFSYLDFSENAFLVRRYEPGTVLRFDAEAFNADEYFPQGLSYSEDWGTWTDGDLLLFQMYTDADSAYLRCDVDVFSTFFGPQTVRIYANDEPVYSGQIDGDQDISFVFSNSANGLVAMRFELPDSLSPCDVTESGDERDLALGLLSMQISPSA